MDLSMLLPYEFIYMHCAAALLNLILMLILILANCKWRVALTSGV